MCAKFVLCDNLCVHFVEIATDFRLKVMIKTTATVGFILYFLKYFKPLITPGNYFKMGSSSYW